MRSLVLSVAALAFLGSVGTASAGCLAGAAAGGVAGHVAGHHGLLGAAAGCAVGHHMAKKKDK
jgi:hypothetical protein